MSPLLLSDGPIHSSILSASFHLVGLSMSVNRAISRGGISRRLAAFRPGRAKKPWSTQPDHYAKIIYARLPMGLRLGPKKGGGWNSMDIPITEAEHLCDCF